MRRHRRRQRRKERERTRRTGKGERGVVVGNGSDKRKLSSFSPKVPTSSPTPPLPCRRLPLPAGRKRRRLLSTESGFFALAKTFAAGIILATGFVHMLHDVEAALADPCLLRFPWRCFPFSGFVAMAAALATLVLDFLVTQFYERKHRAAATAETDATAEDDEGRSITTAALEPPVDEDENEGFAKGGNAMHIVRMRAHAVAHGHSRHHHGHAHGHAHRHAHEDGDEGQVSLHLRHIVASQVLDLKSKPPLLAVHIILSLMTIIK
uniref:Zinc transporter 10 n=1 Tax=Ananas comosus var. bracteatus TaxID=296719 RepID=A0A6V7Q4A9_ANACO|nr:unnamed protein product [Ananas comosus var. bracteatus]